MLGVFQIKVIIITVSKRILTIWEATENFSYHWKSKGSTAMQNFFEGIESWFEDLCIV